MRRQGFCVSGRSRQTDYCHDQAGVDEQADAEPGQGIIADAAANADQAQQSRHRRVELGDVRRRC